MGNTPKAKAAQFTFKLDGTDYVIPAFVPKKRVTKHEDEFAAFYPQLKTALDYVLLPLSVRQQRMDDAFKADLADSILTLRAHGLDAEVDEVLGNLIVGHRHDEFMRIYNEWTGEEVSELGKGATSSM